MYQIHATILTGCRLTSVTFTFKELWHDDQALDNARRELRYLGYKPNEYTLEIQVRPEDVHNG